MNKLVVLVFAAAACAACSSNPTFQTGPDAEVTHDGLTRVDGTIMDAVWARTDIDLTQYRKVRFQGLGVEFRPVQGPYSGRAGMTSMTTGGRNRNEFQLDEATQQLFIEEIRGAFLEEIVRSEVFDVVEEPGPDVITVYAGLLDVVSRVPPEISGRSNIYIDRVGEATLVLEVRDSLSNAIFLRAVDQRAAERQGQMQRSTPATNRAEVRRLGRRWATNLRNGLDTLLTEGASK